MSCPTIWKVEVEAGDLALLARLRAERPTPTAAAERLRGSNGRVIEISAPRTQFRLRIFPAFLKFGDCIHRHRTAWAAIHLPHSGLSTDLPSHKSSTQPDAVVHDRLMGIRLCPGSIYSFSAGSSPPVPVR